MEKWKNLSPGVDIMSKEKGLLTWAGKAEERLSACRLLIEACYRMMSANTSAITASFAETVPQSTNSPALEIRKHAEALLGLMEPADKETPLHRQVTLLAKDPTPERVQDFLKPFAKYS